MEELNRQQTMPALALRGLTVFPQMLLHFDVGRQASIQALDESMASGQPIFLVAQRELAVESPQEKDLYSIGTICNVRQILRLPGDNVRVMVEGVSRGRLCLLPKTTPYLNALVEELPAEQPVRRSTNGGPHSPDLRAVRAVHRAGSQDDPRCAPLGALQ